MGFFLSPGVFTREIDLSDIVPNVATSIGALVGAPTRGDIADPVLITNQEQFFQEYGDTILGNDFYYSALGFLTQGRQLFCMRAINGALFGGVEIKENGSSQANAGFSVGEVDPTAHVFGLDGLFTIYPKDPGVWNNTVKVKVLNIDVVNHLFDIEVWFPNADGVDQRVEVFTGCSRQTKLDGFGIQRYVEIRVNEFSQFIRVKDNTLVVATTDPKEQLALLASAGGTDGAAITDGLINTAWDKFSNPDEITVSLLINGGFTTPSVQNKMISIAEARKDCVAILDMPLADNTATLMQTYRNTTLNANSTYAALYTHWLKIFDEVNDQIVTVPPSGFVAAQYAFTDFVRDPWWAPAGFNRGRLIVSGVSVIFTQGERELLSPDQINVIQSFKGEGIVIWDERTLQTKSSALSSIPIRRLLITLEKSVSTSLRFFVFEPNDDATRLRITSMIEEFLELVQNRRGIESFLVVCDETNNTPAVRERGELLIDVYIKPVFAARFIQLSMIITRLGASFEETIALGA